MASINDRLKKIAAMVIVCCCVPLGTNSAGAFSPDGEDASVIYFAGRLYDLLPLPGPEGLSAARVRDIYVKAEVLTDQLAVAAYNPELQADENECAFIQFAAFASLLLGAEAVLSFASAYIRLTLAPPETPLGSILAYGRIAGKALYMLSVAPKALVNSMLMQAQYWQCRKELEA